MFQCTSRLKIVTTTYLIWCHCTGYIFFGEAAVWGWSGKGLNDNGSSDWHPVAYRRRFDKKTEAISGRETIFLRKGGGQSDQLKNRPKRPMVTPRENCVYTMYWIGFNSELCSVYRGVHWRRQRRGGDARRVAPGQQSSSSLSFFFLDPLVLFFLEQRTISLKR